MGPGADGGPVRQGHGEQAVEPLPSLQDGPVERLVSLREPGDLVAPADGLPCPDHERQFLPVGVCEIGEGGRCRDGAGEPADETQGHLRPGDLVPPPAEAGDPVLGDLVPEPLADPDRLLAGRGEGDLDLGTEPGQPLLVTEGGQATAAGMVLAAELPERVRRHAGGARVGGTWVVPAVPVGDGVGGDRAQTPPDRRGDGLVVVVLFHPWLQAASSLELFPSPKTTWQVTARARASGPAPLSTTRRIESATSPRVPRRRSRRLARSSDGAAK